MPRRLLALLLATLAGCSRCGPPRADRPRQPLTFYLPAKAEGIVWVPDLLRAGRIAAAVEGRKLATFLAQLQGRDSARELVGEWLGQWGIDLRSGEALEAAGIEPLAGAGLAWTRGHGPIVVACARDPDKLARAVGSLAKDRYGLSVATREKAAGHVSWLFTGPVRTDASQAPPPLKLVFADPVAYLGLAEDLDAAAPWGIASESNRLGRDGRFSELLSALPRDPDAVVYLPPGSGWLLGPKASGTAAVFHLSESAWRVDGAAQWSGDAAGLNAFVRQTATSEPTLLLPDAFLIARWMGDTSSVTEAQVPSWASELRQAARGAHLDLTTEVFQNASPGATLVIGVSPEAKLGAAMAASIQLVEVAAVAPVKNVELARRSLPKLPKMAEPFGIPVAVQSPWTGKRPSGLGPTIWVTVKGDRLVAASSQERIERLLAHPGELARPADPDGQEGCAASARLDFRQLDRSIRALPSQAWGVGGFAFRETAIRWLDAMDELVAAGGCLWSEGPRLRGKVELTLK